jgi:acyl transferase domain-containing protein/SAM-dependent methyltransferase/NADP-dependent 3-hydroxy acid dehydrogenase YdfG
VVGSIKTIIGHTEGTAGVAGVLKASLALQHSRIPANLHFQELNPKIQPYYTNLRIPTETVPWPSLPQGGVRRVSVNSFGFGGTNAHAILESYEGGGTAPADAEGSDSGFDTASSEAESVNGDDDHGRKAKKTQEAAVGPFVLSAHSSAALAANASALASHLRAHPEKVDLTALAHTLFRRTPFAFRAAFSACSTAAQLASKLEEATKSLERQPSVKSVFPEALPPRILGIFTGQGAQWATMGRELYYGASASGTFRAAIDNMQQSLDTLPAEEDRPTWRLADQLFAEAGTSRVAEAAISQPLCTALQVALVDTLRAAGIEFAGAVGHSSGEIAAAYTAGYLNATDAIRVAYYRGFHAHRAQGPGAGRGKMMAVGMGWEQATAFCAEFDGALVTAASNSHTSCTLAGDAEAVDKAFARLQQEGTFARVLQVDTAYHSHHMKPCADPYLASMKACGVKLQERRGQQQKCTWYSSVWDNDDHKVDGKLLEGQYWVDNLTRPVKFSQALARALDQDHAFDLAFEVGPHPALKGPASETIKTSSGGAVSLPYTSALKRGQNAVESFTDALGTVWCLFPSPPTERPLVTFDGVRRALQRDTADNLETEDLKVLKGLPPYSWNHATPIWKESRTSRLFRVGSRLGHGRHELLGHPVVYGGGARDSKREVHWKQVLRLQDLPWLAGHVIQGEVLFPASGYLSMAYEAALQLAVDDDEKKQKVVRLVELHDVDIVRAMRLEQDSGLEMVLTVRVTSQSDDCITAQVACYSGPVDAPLPLDAPQTALSAHFTGGVRLWLSDQEEEKEVLPYRAEESARPLPMDALDMDQLYSSLAEVGLQYTSPFKAKAMLRRLHRATVTLATPPETSALHACMHPAPVDTAAQGLLAAFSFPGDDRLSTLYLPTRVDSVRIVPPSSRLSADASTNENPSQQQLTADAMVTSTADSTIVGDIDVFNAADEVKVQIRGITLTAVGQQQRDAWLYAGTKWVRDADSAIEPEHASTLSDALNVQYEVLSRASYWYLQQFRALLPQEMLIMSKSYKRNVTWALEHLLPEIESGKHSGLPGFKPEWKNDTAEIIQALQEESISSQKSEEERYHCKMHWDFLHSVGTKLISVVRSMTPWVRIWTRHQLEWVYADGIGYSAANRDAATYIAQLAHRYPRLNIVDVGAGSGGTSGAVLKALQEQQLQVGSYNYTDISSDFLDRARELHGHHKNVTFKKLDIDKDPASQGFPDGTYDVVIASKILHKLKSLEDSLRRCRQMLRPGGQLILLEPTDDFLMSQIVKLALPDFFVGLEDGRVNGPTVNLEHWDRLLRITGFAGADKTSTRTVSYCSVIVAHAVDDTVQLLREPLAAPPEKLAPALGDVFIVAGGDAITSDLASQCQNLLQAATSSGKVTIVPGLDAVDTAQNISPGSTVLCLAELNHPVFQNDEGDMAKRFRGLQDLMSTAGSVLWVTAGARSGRDPRANMVVGMGSTLRAERGSSLRLQFLDVDEPSALLESSVGGPALLAKLLVRLAIFDPVNADDVLWTQEPELAMGKDGALYIPRVLALDAPNRRNAARRRKVTQQIALPSQSQGAAVVLERGQEASWDLKTAELLESSASEGKGVVRVQVTASSLQRFTFSDGGLSSAAQALHVCIGQDVASGEKVVALSEVNGSLVSIAQEHHVLRRWSQSDKDNKDDDLAWLQTFLARASASRLLLDVRGPAWVHGAPAQLGEALDVVAREKGIAIFQTTSTAGAAGVATFVHPYAGEEDLLNLPLPKGLQTFVNLSTSQSGAAVKALCSARSIETKQVDWADLTTGLEFDGLDHLAKSHDVVLDSGRIGESVVTLEQASAGLLPVEQQLSPAAVVDWTASETVTADVPQLEHKGLFAPDKTYLLCGMTGDMGISVCLWMVEHGARHVVLMSRNPKISSRILDHMAGKFGADVRPMAVDITNLASLRAAVTALKADNRPIGGVMNGAMILRDRLFQNMPWEDFATVLGPKVDGSRNLDAILSEDEQNSPLDFFICLSSITSIAGNVGQSAYAAANQYMTGLVRQRRRRGLAASVLHIAILTGFGYIHRSDAAHAETMNKSLRTRYNNQAEPDLHAMLAEAIVGGRVRDGDNDSDSTTAAELITGLRTVFEGEKSLDARLARYLRDDEGDDLNAGAEGGGAAKSVQAQLAEIGADADAGEQRVVLENAFAIALGKLLEMDPETIDPARPVASLGVDSLVAIRIREWMLREMGVDLSVIKVMSDTYPMSRMCEDVLVSWRKQQKKDK